jgi:hypothetical protein
MIQNYNFDQILAFSDLTPCTFARRNMLHPSLTLKIELVCPIETLVAMHQTTRCHGSQDHNQTTHRLGNLTSIKCNCNDAALDCGNTVRR